MKFLLVFCLFLSFTACSSKRSKVSVVQYGEIVQRAATEKVLVFKDKTTVGRPFKEIARLSFIGNRDRERTVNKLIEKAKELGANAIILEPADIQHSSGLVSSVSFLESASAIVFE